MRHDYIDRYARLDTPVHRLPSWCKLLAAVIMLVWTVVTPPSETWYFGGCALFLILAVIVARLPIGFVALRLLTLEPLVIGVAVLALLQPGGVAVMLRILLKSNLCLLTVVLLSNTTPFADILRVLRSLRVPSLLVTILALMYRYVFLLIDQAERMSRARESRTFTLRRAGRWRVAAGVVSQLFVRSTERAERIYAAMTARGWES
ncbi:MAG TPA: cobalt ECF transporter T component CbiQ [Bacteroidota bacterium]|nr:cobalt ECF transporter T component CbiQ [Bacteroidota bacterium]